MIITKLLTSSVFNLDITNEVINLYDKITNPRCVIKEAHNQPSTAYDTIKVPY